MMEKLAETIRIDASTEQVWSVLADIGSISTWAAPIEPAEVAGELGEGAARYCIFTDGRSIEETFLAWEDGRLQRSEIDGDVPGVEVVAEWCLAESQAGGTLVTYRARFETGRRRAIEEIRQELEGTNRSILEALKAYVETGTVPEPVEH